MAPRLSPGPALATAPHKTTALAAAILERHSCLLTCMDTCLAIASKSMLALSLLSRLLLSLLSGFFLLMALCLAYCLRMLGSVLMVASCMLSRFLIVASQLMCTNLFHIRWQSSQSSLSIFFT